MQMHQLNANQGPSVDRLLNGQGWGSGCEIFAAAQPLPCEMFHMERDIPARDQLTPCASAQTLVPWYDPQNPKPRTHQEQVP